MEDNSAISIDESPHKPTGPYHPKDGLARFAYQGSLSGVGSSSGAGTAKRVRTADIVANASSSGASRPVTSGPAWMSGSSKAGSWGAHALAVAQRHDPPAAASQPARRAVANSRVLDSDDEVEVTAAVASAKSAGATDWMSARPIASSGAAAAPPMTKAGLSRATRNSGGAAVLTSSSAKSAPVRRSTRSAGRAPAAKQRRVDSDDEADDGSESGDDEDGSASSDDDDDDGDSDDSFGKPSKHGKRKRKSARGAAGKSKGKGKVLRRSQRAQKQQRRQIDDSDEDEYADEDNDDEEEEDDYDGGSDGEASAGGGDSVDSDVSVDEDEDTDEDEDEDGGGSSDGNSSERSAKRRLRRKERAAARGGGPVTRGSRRLVKAAAATSSPEALALDRSTDAEISVVTFDQTSGTAAAAAAPQCGPSLHRSASAGGVDDDDDDDIIVGGRRSTAAVASASQVAAASAATAAGSSSAGTRGKARSSDSGDESEGEGESAQREGGEAAAARAEAMEVGTLLRLERSERKQLAHLVVRAVRVKADTMRSLGSLLPAVSAPASAASDGSGPGVSASSTDGRSSNSGAAAASSKGTGESSSSSLSSSSSSSSSVGVITPSRLQQVLGIGVSDLPVSAPLVPAPPSPGMLEPGSSAAKETLALKPHQLLGVNWLHLLFRTGVAGCVVADAMGLGKTPQTCVFLSYLAVQADRCAARAAKRSAGSAGVPGGAAGQQSRPGIDDLSAAGSASASAVMFVSDVSAEPDVDVDGGADAVIDGEYSDPGMFLIVTPASTVGNWLRELARWAPSLRVGVFRGGARRGVEMVSAGTPAAVATAAAASAVVDAGTGSAGSGSGFSNVYVIDDDGEAEVTSKSNDKGKGNDNGKGKGKSRGEGQGAIAIHDDSNLDSDSDSGGSAGGSSLNTSYDGQGSNGSGDSDADADGDADAGEESDDAEDAAKRAAEQLRGHRKPTPQKARSRKGGRSGSTTGTSAAPSGSAAVAPRGGRRVDVLLTTYSVFDRSGESGIIDRSFLLALGPFGVVVLDEGHAVKNAQSARHKHLSSLSSGARMRVLLSGTPVQNDLRELLSLLRFVAGRSAVKIFSDDTLQAMEGQLTGGAGVGSKAKGKAQAKGKQGKGKKGDSDEDEQPPPLKDRVASLLRRICEPYILRRRKGDVLLSLPPKTDVTVPLDMLPQQRRLYESEIAAARQAAGMPAPVTATVTVPVAGAAAAPAAVAPPAAPVVLDLTVAPTPTPAPAASPAGAAASSSQALPSTVPLPSPSPMPTPSPLPSTVLPSPAVIEISEGEGAGVSAAPAPSAALGIAAAQAVIELVDDANSAVAQTAAAGIVAAAGPSVIDITDASPSPGAAAVSNAGPSAVPASVIELDSDGDGIGAAASSAAPAASAKAARSAPAGKAAGAAASAAAASAAAASAAATSVPVPARKSTRRTAGGADPIFAAGLDHVHTAVASASAAAAASAGRAAAGAATGRGGKAKASPLTARAATSLFTALRKAAQHPVLGQSSFADPALRQCVAAALHRCGAFGARPDNSLSSWLGSPEPPAGKGGVSTTGAGAGASSGGGGGGGGVTVERIATELAGMSDFAIHGMCVAFGGRGPTGSGSSSKAASALASATATSETAAAAAAAIRSAIAAHPLASSWFALDSKESWAHTGGYQPDVEATEPVRAALAALAASAATSEGGADSGRMHMLGGDAGAGAGAGAGIGIGAGTEAGAGAWSSEAADDEVAAAVLRLSAPASSSSPSSGLAAGSAAPQLSAAPVSLPSRFRSADEARVFLRSCRLPLSALFSAAKVQWLARVLPRMIVQGHRVLLFSQWTMVLDVLQDALDALRIRCCRLDGSTAVEERQPIIDAFSGGHIPVFLLSTRAGGLGLNLTAADRVVIYDSDLNPHVDAQAVDRAHRIGQTRPVSVFRLLCKETVDETICRIADRKAALDAALVMSSRPAGALPGLGLAFDDGSSLADADGARSSAGSSTALHATEDVTSLLLAALQRA